MQPVNWLDKACPKCAYVRTTADTNPAWQCPRCHIAYAKFAAAAAPVGARLAAHGREMADEASHDSSLVVLVIANVVVLAIAYFTHMSLRSLLFVYWMQSVVIGVTHVIRVLSLQRFSTEGFRPEAPGEMNFATQHAMAAFFVMHYGGFHLAYFSFLVRDREAAGQPLLAGAGGSYALCALIFTINHAFSLARNVKSDAAGTPSLATLMVLPYARIVPMHVMVLGGAFLMAGTSTFALFAFGLLKTIADVLTHALDHHMMGWKLRSSANPRRRPGGGEAN
jgi:hypothetical protein